MNIVEMKVTRVSDGTRFRIVVGEIGVPVALALYMAFRKLGIPDCPDDFISWVEEIEPVDDVIEFDIKLTLCPDVKGCNWEMN